MSLIKSTSLTTPPVIFASNPFVAFSHVVRDGSSLVVTLSSISSFATQGLKADLSSDEGSEEVLEDSDDELVVKTRVFDSDKASDDDE